MIGMYMSQQVQLGIGCGSWGKVRILGVRQEPWLSWWKRRCREAVYADQGELE